MMMTLGIACLSEINQCRRWSATASVVLQTKLICLVRCKLQGKLPTPAVLLTQQASVMDEEVILPGRTRSTVGMNA